MVLSSRAAATNWVSASSCLNQMIRHDAWSYCQHASQTSNTLAISRRGMCFSRLDPPPPADLTQHAEILKGMSVVATCVSKLIWTVSKRIEIDQIHGKKKKLEYIVSSRITVHICTKALTRLKAWFFCKNIKHESLHDCHFFGEPEVIKSSKPLKWSSCLPLLKSSSLQVLLSRLFVSKKRLWLEVEVSWKWDSSVEVGMVKTSFKLLDSCFHGTH